MIDTASTEGFQKNNMLLFSNLIAKPFVMRSFNPFNVPYYADFLKISNMVEKFAEKNKDVASR